MCNQGYTKTTVYVMSVQHTSLENSCAIHSYLRLTFGKKAFELCKLRDQSSQSALDTISTLLV